MTLIGKRERTMQLRTIAWSRPLRCHRRAWYKTWVGRTLTNLSCRWVEWEGLHYSRTISSHHLMAVLYVQMGQQTYSPPHNNPIPSSRFKSSYRPSISPVQLRSHRKICRQAQVWCTSRAVMILRNSTQSWSRRTLLSNWVRPFM